MWRPVIQHPGLNTPITSQVSAHRLGDTKGIGGHLSKHPLQKFGDGNHWVRGWKGKGEDGVAVVVPVYHHLGPLDSAVKPQCRKGGDARRGLHQSI